MHVLFFTFLLFSMQKSEDTIAQTEYGITFACVVNVNVFMAFNSILKKSPNGIAFV